MRRLAPAALPIFVALRSGSSPARALGTVRARRSTRRRAAFAAAAPPRGAADRRRWYARPPWPSHPAPRSSARARARHRVLVPPSGAPAGGRLLLAFAATSGYRVLAECATLRRPGRLGRSSRRARRPAAAVRGHLYEASVPPPARRSALGAGRLDPRNSPLASWCSRGVHHPWGRILVFAYVSGRGRRCCRRRGAGGQSLARHERRNRIWRSSARSGRPSHRGLPGGSSGRRCARGRRPEHRLLWYALAQPWCGSGLPRHLRDRGAPVGRSVLAFVPRRSSICSWVLSAASSRRSCLLLASNRILLLFEPAGAGSSRPSKGSSAERLEFDGRSRRSRRAHHDAAGQRGPSRARRAGGLRRATAAALYPGSDRVALRSARRFGPEASPRIEEAAVIPWWTGSRWSRRLFLEPSPRGRGRRGRAAGRGGGADRRLLAACEAGTVQERALRRVHARSVVLIGWLVLDRTLRRRYTRMRSPAGGARGPARWWCVNPGVPADARADRLAVLGADGGRAGARGDAIRSARSTRARRSCSAIRRRARSAPGASEFGSPSSSRRGRGDRVVGSVLDYARPSQGRSGPRESERGVRRTLHVHGADRLGAATRGPRVRAVARPRARSRSGIHYNLSTTPSRRGRPGRSPVKTGAARPGAGWPRQRRAWMEGR
jgi:hypothetical protein